MTRKVITPEMLESMQEMHDKGLTVNQLSMELGISTPTIYKYLMIMGLEPNGRRVSKVDTQEVIDAYMDLSRTVGSVLDEFDMSTTAMYSILRKAGVPPRQKSEDYVGARQKQMDHALKLYQESDMTVMKICYETGISQPMLHKEIRARGLEFRNPRMAAKIVDKEGKLVNPEAEKWDD